MFIKLQYYNIQQLDILKINYIIVLSRTVRIRTVWLDEGGDFMSKESENDDRRNILGTLRSMQRAFFTYTFGSTDQKFNKALANKGWIMKYLFSRKDEIVYQKDIENSLNLPKSTIATILKKMETDGVIRRTLDEGDTRLKKICLTQQGLAEHLNVEKHFRETNQKACEGIPAEEMEIFYKVSEKIIGNLRRH